MKKLKKTNKKAILFRVSITILVIVSFWAGFKFNTIFDSGFSFKASASKTPIVIPGILEEVRSYLDTSFISWKASSTLPTEKELSYGLIRGYVEAYGDPYTVFFDPEESKMFEEDMKGSFGGIGATISHKDGNPVIQSVLKDTPAEKNGLLSGDIIISVNGEYVQDKSVEEIVSRIRGEIDTEVVLEVLHKEALNVSEISIIRKEIIAPVLDTEQRDDVYIIHLYSFTETSGILFEEALQKFAVSGADKLIIDIRGNGGGYLESAVNIASFFLAKDKPIVIEKGGKKVADKDTYSKGFDYFRDYDLDLVVLIDGGSASASEILAGALKDNEKAVIVGERSFGKGSVQQLIKLSDGSDLKLTISKWYTPSGVNISENGIEPDIVATSSSYLELDSKGEIIDTQLEKAIEIIRDLKK